MSLLIASRSLFKFNWDLICLLFIIFIFHLLHLSLYEQCFLFINQLYLSNPIAKFILLGDFNLPSLDWSLYSSPLICNSQIDSYFVSMLSHYNFNQFNLVRNHNIIILDLALSNVHISSPMTQTLYYQLIYTTRLLIYL